MSNYNPQEALKQYRQLGIESEVSNASPHRLIQLLFEGALSRLAAAQGAIERNDLAVKGELIGKAISIVGGLRASLDMNAGEISERLDQLYEYINFKLLEASAQNDVEKVNEVIQLLKTVKSGWDEIAPQVSGSSA
ncbi:flagella export chaperone FliS [Cellvibrio sp. KY-GH-1]|uniref:flagellar export chaperone FliS n=1 Tax=Cellvibrio sp. KY-GH-1 TaxID=2303332 RepID=UPI0012442A77|nr:flagellar export chaperone FliS [Cellvibrio sp. KY-GH-1]QEY14963.1 flagella export chaperone FliS [Cellvibrio sp. KY-GH-1]